MKGIIVYDWMKEKAPVLTALCEVVNAALRKEADMTLAEFAGIINEVNKEHDSEVLCGIGTK